MSATRQIPRIAGIAGIGTSIVAVAAQPSIRDWLVKWTGIQAPGGVWRIVAIFLAIINLKNLPFVWHIRLFKALIYHLHIQPTPFPKHALFQPIITSTRTPLLECDYNLHKSNSTYFSDIDISRTHLVTALLRIGIKRQSERHAKKTGVEQVGESMHEGSHLVALGAVSCQFRREIPPYQKYEMWTRLLCWDRKWLYFVTHLVKPGVARPERYTLQPWKRSKKNNTQEKGDHDEQKERERLKGAVYASSIAKYVVKKGRLTIHPEQVLTRADMLPPKPEGWVYKGDQNGIEVDSVESAVLPAIEGEDWTWDHIEAERLRGLKLAEIFGALDGLHDEFDGGKKGVLGRYADLLY